VCVYGLMEMVKKGAYDLCTLYICIKTEQWNPLKLFEEVGEEIRNNDGEGESSQGSLYAHMEMSQWTPLYN
jgi:hypothetical protein